MTTSTVVAHNNYPRAASSLRSPLAAPPPIRQLSASTPAPSAPPAVPSAPAAARPPPSTSKKGTVPGCR